MDCIDILKQGVGRELKEEELVDLMEKAKLERRKIQAAGEPDVAAALERALKQGADDVRIREIAKRRAAMLDFKLLSENMDFVLNSFGDRPWDGLDALVSGSSLARKGARDSVEARQNFLSNMYTQGFMADIEALGLTKTLNKGDLDQEIARALQVADDPANAYSGPPAAMEIAKVMRKWENTSIDAANQAGSFIRKLPGYIVSQSHERARIKRAGFEEWKKVILPELDVDRTFDPDGPARRALGADVVARSERRSAVWKEIESLRKQREETRLAFDNEFEAIAQAKKNLPRGHSDRAVLDADLAAKKADKKALDTDTRARLLDLQEESMGLRKDLRELKRMEDMLRSGRPNADEFLYHVWQGLSSGEHLKYDAKARSFNPAVGAAARRLSHERVLHFKDADSWWRYNEAFGSGNLREAFVHGLERQAKTTAIMQVLGPSGSDNWEQLLLELKKYFTKTRNQAALDNLHGAKAFKRGETVLRNRLKEVDGSMNIPGSETLATFGTVTRGLETGAKLGDVVATSVSDMPLFGAEFSYQGYGFFKPMADGLKQLVAGRPSAEKQAILSEVGVMLESFSGSLLGKFSGEELPGKTSRLMRTYFKLNLLTWWTDKWRTAAALGMSHGLAARKGLDYAGLKAAQPELARTLGLYGIDAAKWDVLRQVPTRSMEGKEFLTAAAVRELPENVFTDYLKSQGIKSTPARVRNIRTELEMQLGSYFRDRVDYAVLQPDSKTRATLRQGQDAGTYMGEGLRWFAQFKAFPTAVLQRTWAREVYGRGADSFAQALRNGNGEVAGMARMVLMMTLFGYGISASKALRAGKEPRPLDAENWHKTMAASLLQGGGFGIVGDMFFGEWRKTRGGGLVGTLGGPFLSSFEQALDIGGRMSEGDNFAAAALRFGISHTPGNNLFYVKPIFDQAIGHQLFEMLSPGYIDRTMRRARKEHGQEFWLRPGSLSIL